MSREKAVKKIEARAARIKRRRSYAQILRLVSVFALLLFFGGILYLTLGDAFHSSTSQIVGEENVHEILDRFDETRPAKDISFEAVMNYTWQFPDGKSFSTNAYVENSNNNKNTLYFTVNLSDSNQTLLYISPNLAPGEALDEIRLDATLPAGSYNTILTYYLLDDAGDVSDTLKMAVTIIVEQ